jgi:hypothetical protein
VPVPEVVVKREGGFADVIAKIENLAFISHFRPGGRGFGNGHKRHRIHRKG